MYIAAVSLGGSQLAHYLANANPVDNLKAAILISAPLDLRASANFMKNGLNRLYIYKFTRSLLKKYRAKAELIGHTEFESKLASARNFWDLDEGATAPMHGFKGAEDYYDQMSANRSLTRINFPTLYLASKDDPFVPASSMPEAVGGVPAYLSDKGGHVGFIDQKGESWMVPTVFKFLKQY
jgi:predicted alpha/beta-fold hydrolase